MTETNCHPAVLAGLMGSATWGVPKYALALSVENVTAAVSNSLVLQFAVGCAAGAVIAGIISVISDHMASREERFADDDADLPNIEAGLPEDRWSSSSLSLYRAQAAEEDDDPTGDLKRFRTGQITIDVPVQEEKPARRRQARRSGARHFATAAQSRTAKGASKQVGRHFATARKDAPAELRELGEKALATPQGKHFAQSVATLETARRSSERRAAHAAAHAATHAAPVQGQPKAAANTASERPMATAQTAEDRVARARERLANLPYIESRYDQIANQAAALAAQVPTVTEVLAPHPVIETSFTEHPATTTGRLRLRDRMAARAKGVRQVLAERIGSDAFEGVPMITRADGSSVDVTPSWFDQTLAPALASITGITGRLEDTAPQDFSDAGTRVPTPAVAADGDARSSYIARHVAEVNVGMFPERRSGDELEHEDVFEEALAAMGETLGQQQAPVFQDVVGGPSTIDDPDGMEGPTGFIPFRVPAAHPEVVDTESYIDYLLRDELSQNDSSAIRRSSHTYLRVIEGGTNPMHIRRRAGETGSLGTGRHFSSSRYAAEA